MVKARFLENSFFSNIYKQVDTQIEAPKIVFIEMKAAFLTELPSTQSNLYLTQALAEKTNNADTHPCLSDRLNALECLPKNQEEISIPATIKVSAAREVLGTALDKLIDYFNQNWYDRMATPWRQKYAQVQESLATLKNLDNKYQEDKLNTEESWQRIKLTLELKGEAVALPLLQELLDTDSEDVSANYLMGHILLNQQNSSGIKYIERAIDKDVHIVVDGCQLIYSFLMQQGDTNAAKLYRQRAEKHYDKMLKAQQEREYIQTSDKFKPHGLSKAQLHTLCQQLSRYTEIRKVFLVQKTVEHFPDKPLYILGVMRKVGFWGEVDSEVKNSYLIKQLTEEIEFEHNIFFLMLTGQYANFEKSVSEVSDALIYSSKKS